MSLGLAKPYSLEFSDWADIGTVAASSRGTQVTSGATANTKGAWVQLIASTAADIDYIEVDVDTFNATASTAVIDIGVGASGSEVAVLSNLTGGSTGDVSGKYHFPISIPAGTRISARSQSPTASDIIETLVHGAPSALQTLTGTGVDTYGFTSATTFGTTIDPGATANTKGSWTQITASLTNDLIGFVLGLDMQNAANAGSSLSSENLLDVGIGASGSEIVLVGNLKFNHDANTTTVYVSPQVLGPYFTPIPAGTRIAVRAQSTQTNSTYRKFGITFYGIRA